MIGKTILHYKILEKLGEGGMGVVYKAEDTKLERIVALKFLSLTSIGDEEKKRFQREAKAAASLNHPNIATVFAIDEVDDQTFIAMEFIEGKSLHEIVGDGHARPLPLDKAIDYATQTAAGLQAAHEKGITHRDIKSANIMVTDKGQIKIMDFGLAKLANRSKMTQLGTTLGTIAYMSPEQARGETVDHRADIWSLGVVLYEMISGQMPFKGDYEQAVIYSIQNEEPEPLTAVRTGVPMKLEEIVNKLLAKEPRDRYQNIMELPVDLKNVSVQKTTTSQIGSSRIRDTVQREKQLNVKVNYSYKTILTIAVTALITFALTWFFKPSSTPPELKRRNNTIFNLPESNFLFFSTKYNRMAISPDGMDIVYDATGLSRMLYLKRAGSFETVGLEGTAGARAPFFSPDGRWIGYVNRETNEIYKVLVEGGEPFKITSFNGARSSATWAPDNTVIFTDDSVLKRISETGGQPAILTKVRRSGEQHHFPHMLPDGKSVIFTVRDERADLSTSRLAVYRFGDDDYRVILDEEGYNAVYSHTGYILYGRSDRLMAVPFDLKNLRMSGLPAPVLDNVQTNRRSGSMSYALSREGTIIYIPGIADEHDLRSVWTVDLAGKATELFDLKKEFEFARYSPNGKYVAFCIDKDNRNLWVYYIDGGAINQVTFFKEGGARRFAWSPDSKRLAYATTAEDSTNSIYVKRIDGTDTAQKIYTSPSSGNLDVVDWSTDDNKISFHQLMNPAFWDIFVYSIGDSSATPFLATPGNEFAPEFSPNGKWLLYESRESGIFEIYVRSYPKSSGGVWKISNGGGGKPVWSPDGKKIYYKNGNEMYSVDVTTTDTFSKGNPKKIFEGNYFLFQGMRSFDIHPDGDRFIMIQRLANSSQNQKIFVIQNFDEELKRLVPVGKD